jgi:hypothetical protein
VAGGFGSSSETAIRSRIVLRYFVKSLESCCASIDQFSHPGVLGGDGPNAAGLAAARCGPADHGAGVYPGAAVWAEPAAVYCEWFD